MLQYTAYVPQDGKPYTADEAIASLEQAYSRTPREPATLSAPDDYPLTDAGNASFLPSAMLVTPAIATI